eukprot:3952542-Pyramimonas_sp.AAC.1
MQFPGFAVSDAGQAYEALEPGAIRQAVDALFARAERDLNTRTLSGLHASSSQVVLGGRIGVRHWDRAVFIFRSLKRAIEGFLGFRFFMFSGIALVQLSGIPIGGPLSGAILHL